jgi:hypothetical protein
MRARSLALAVLALGAIVGANTATTACTGGVTDDPGLNAYLRVSGAQFVPGAMPAGTSAGPQVLSLDLLNSLIYPSFPDDGISGDLSATATAAAIGLQGDVGYWIVVAGAASYLTPTDPTYAATGAFSQGIVAGQYTLVVRGVDGQRNFGPPSTRVLTALAAPPLEPIPTGDLVVTLSWNNDTNLDLHVVDPAGQDLYWGAQSTQPPLSFEQPDGGSYGAIDDDSNANCVIDGLDREDAVWKDPPPSGTYTVRVDAASLCGLPIAYWTVKVTLNGSSIGEASGTAVEADTIGTHGAGSGVTALTFDVP